MLGRDLENKKGASGALVLLLPYEGGGEAGNYAAVGASGIRLMASCW